MNSNILLLFILFGIGCSGNTKVGQESLILWEDDFLKIEILSKQNFEFVTYETARINTIKSEDFDSIGDSSVFELNVRPIETKEIRIDTKEFVKILNEFEIKKYPRLLNYRASELKEIIDSNIVAYGQNNSALFIEEENGIIINLWLAIYSWEFVAYTNFKLALKEIGSKYKLILVDWLNGEVVNLNDQKEIDKYFE